MNFIFICAMTMPYTIVIASLEAIKKPATIVFVVISLTKNDVQSDSHVLPQ